MASREPIAMISLAFSIAGAFFIVIASILALPFVAFFLIYAACFAVATLVLWLVWLVTGWYGIAVLCAAWYFHKKTQKAQLNENDYQLD